MTKTNLYQPKNNEHTNIKLIPENLDGQNGFNIYIDFSGQREYLMTYRHNGPLYNLLKNGIKLDDLIRYKFKKKSGHQKRYYNKENQAVDHLLRTVDDYLLYSM